MKIDITNNRIAWDWSQSIGGPADGFRLKYGLQSGVYTDALQIDDPTVRDIPATQIATLGSGPYFVVVVAFNSDGESAASNEISFDIAAVPVAPSNLRLELIVSFP